MSPSKKQSLVKIVNPPPGFRKHCTRSHAERYRRRGDARFDAVGRLVFTAAGFARWAAKYAVATPGRGLRHSPRLVVASAQALPANVLTPDVHTVMPVSPEWLRRMGY